MTATLERLLTALQARPEAEQETYAARWLEQLCADSELEAQLATSPALLDQLALEALREDRAGLTRPMDELCEEMRANEVAS